MTDASSQPDGVEMGLVIFYQTTARMSAVRKTAIEQRAEELCGGRNWVNCQPLTFAPWRSGRLRGKSRDDGDCPSSETNRQSLFGEHARVSDQHYPAPSLPDGRLVDVVEFLCDLSVEFGVVWEIRLERFGSMVGTVRNGRCDEQLLETARRVEPLSDLLGLEPIPSPPFLGPTRLVDTLIDEWGCDLRSIHLRLLDSEADSPSAARETEPTEPLPLPIENDVSDDGPTILPFPRIS